MNLGWDYLTTDKLARHPGRPWSAETQTIPNRVANHYRTLSVEALLSDVLFHYRKIYQEIERAVLIKQYLFL